MNREETARTMVHKYRKIGRIGIIWITGISGFLSICAAAHRIDMPDTLVPAGAQIETVAQEIDFAEGPAVTQEGALYFTELKESRIWVAAEGEPATVYMDSSQGANGLYPALDTGALYACAGHTIIRIQRESAVVETLVSTLEDETAGSCNDLCVTEQGDVYFTKPDYAAPFGGHVYRYCEKNGLSRILSDLPCPNGIVFNEKDSLLYLNISKAHQTRSYRIASDGTPKLTDTIAAYAEPDGLALDEYGNIYIASYSDATVYVVSPEGTQIGSIEIDDRSVTNCCFSRGQTDALYITARTGVYKLSVLVKGAFLSAHHLHGFDAECGRKSRGITKSYVRLDGMVLQGNGHSKVFAAGADECLMRMNGRILPAAAPDANEREPAGVIVELPSP